MQTDALSRCQSPAAERLRAAMDHAHEQALTALTDPGARPADAVVWLSAHLAAARHALHPALATVGSPDSRRADTRRLLSEVRVLEHLCAGGPVPRGMTLPMVRDAVVRSLVDHAMTEESELCQLAELIDEAQLRALHARYSSALRNGPTRPHPWGPHRGRLERVTFALDAARDHLLDVLDARVIPLPRPEPRTPAPPGRWGHYLLGTSDGDSFGR